MSDGFDPKKICSCLMWLLEFKTNPIAQPVANEASRHRVTTRLVAPGKPLEIGAPLRATGAAGE